MKQRLLILLLALMSGLGSMAQTGTEMSVTITIPPPYSPYLSDYSDLLDQGIVTITNLTNVQRSVKVVGFIQSDIGLSASTSPGYQPPLPLVFQPFETKVLLASQQNQDYLDAANMNVQGSQQLQQNILVTGVLPEGNYEICLQALDYFTSEPLSPEAPSGCVFFPVIYAQPPFLISPLCEDSVIVANNILPFTWMPVSAPTMMPMLYDLYVVKLMAGQNPNDAINGAIHFGAGNPIVKTNLVATSTVTLPSDLPLEMNSWYAWCVVAHDPGQTVWVENNGRSEVCTFYVKSPFAVPDPPAPGPDYVPNFNYGATYEMPPMATITGNLKYRFVGDNPGSIGSLGSLGGSIPNFNNWFSGGGSGTGSTGGTTSGGVSSGVSGGSIGSPIGINPDLFADIMGGFEAEVPPIAAPPSWVLPTGYNAAGGLPLKNTNVVFTARYAVGINPVVNSTNDLQLVAGVSGTSVTLTSSNSMPLGSAAVQVGSAMVDANGNFTSYMMMTQPYGLIADGMVTVDVLTGDLAGSYTGYGLYRLVTMEIPDVRYCHPDVYLFPQPGQPLQVPQQVVHVKSYNLNVTVRANNNAEQAAGTDNPIDGAIVRIGRLTQTYNNFPPSYPMGESKMTQYGYSLPDVAGPDVLLCDSLKTNGQGKVLFTRLVKSTSQCNSGQSNQSSASLFADGYYLEAFTHETQGNYNYHKSKVWNLAPCENIDPNAFTGDNSDQRSHGYQPTTYPYELILNPKDPEIYASVMADYGTGPFGVPHSNLVFLIKKPGVPNITQVLQTDHKGLLKKQLQIGDFFNGFASKNWQTGQITSEYLLWGEKSGYTMGDCIGCSGVSGSFKKLVMGERWTPQVFMNPNGKVVGIVRDEDGNPIEGEVKIGDGVFLPLELLFTYVPSFESPSGGGSSGSSSGSSSSGGSTSGSGSSGGGSFNPMFNSSLPPGVWGAIGGGTTGGTTGGSTSYDVYNGDPISTNYGIGDLFAGDSYNVSFGGPASDMADNFSMESVFNFPAQSGNNIQIIIKPYATNLFQDTFYVNIPVNNTNNPTNLGIFTLKKKLHRPVITVISGAASAVALPISQAQVILSDFDPVLTNNQGIAAFLFPSPANEFRLQIIKDGFAYYDEHVAIPISKTPYPITVYLQPGHTVSGTVTDEMTGLPIPGARVTCTIGSNAYGDIVLEAVANSQGQYTMPNVPAGLRYMRASFSDENITYVSDAAWGNVPSPGPRHFSLFPAPFHMPNIWNLPTEIHSVSISGSGWSVTGAFRQLPENQRFKAEKPSQRLHFSNVQVGTTGGTTSSGQPLAQPTGTQITTSEVQFRAILNNQHMMSITGPSGMGSGTNFTYNPNMPSVPLNPLKVFKNTANGNGEVSAKAFVLLEAFRMEYQYEGHFYLGENHTGPNLSVFKGTADPSMPESYYLMDIVPISHAAKNPQYTVHNFPAHADRTKSYLRGDSLVLKTVLNVDLPLSNPDKIEVNAGKIIILPNEIQIFPGTEPLEFNLETWQVTTSGWTFSDAHGGILAAGTIKTNIFDLTAPMLIIRPNELIMPNAQSVAGQGINIGGIAPVTFAPGSQLSFGYYNGPQHDPNNGHWRVALFNGDGIVGNIANMPGWAPDEKLNFMYTENFSDGFLKFTMAPNQYINHYNVINQYVTGMNVNSDGFTLVGPIDLGIPNLSGGYSLNMVYFKEQGQVKVRPNGLVTAFETYGQVYFQGDQQADRITLAPNLLRVPGWMTIYDDQSPNTIMLRAMLEKTPNSVRLDIMQVDQGGQLAGNIHQKINLGGGNTGKQKVLEGFQLVQNGQWKPLEYLAQFDGYTGSMNAGKDQMWFVVTGAITNDQSKPQSIELANVPTPFGDFSLTLLFEDMEIVGALSMQNIPLGSVIINSGSAEMRVGGKGFYLVAGLNAAYPVIGNLQTNFIAGWYPNITPEANSILGQGMYLKKLPNFMQTGGIQGMYICANKTLLHVDWEIDLLLFAAGLYIDTGVDTRFWVNFSDDAGEATVGGLAYFDMELFASVFGVCNTCFGFLAELGMEAKTTWNPDGGFSASAFGTLAVNMSMCGESINESAKVDGSFSSTAGLDVTVTFGQAAGDNLSLGGGGCKHFVEATE